MSTVLAQKAHRPRIKLGQIVATPGALEALEEAHQSPQEFLERHQSGDWGEVGAEDWKQNELSVKKGSGAMSVYTLPTGTKIWIITEADQSVTTVLLPDEY
jgi:hypothetical protein